MIFTKIMICVPNQMSCRVGYVIRSVLFVSTLALFAIMELFGVRFRLFATVTTIPVAFLDVVVIIADAVTLVFCNSTIGCLELRVQTFAFEAVFKLVSIAIVTTAVATVPATSAAVVVVVAEIIALVFCRTALAFALQPFLMVCFVLTFALLTVSELSTVTVITAVAVIVITFRHIVHIIAETVLHVPAKTLGTLMLGVFA